MTRGFADRLAEIDRASYVDVSRDMLLPGEAGAQLRLESYQRPCHARERHDVRRDPGAVRLISGGFAHPSAALTTRATAGSLASRGP